MAVGKISVGTLEQFHVTPGTMITEITDDACYKCGKVVVIDLAMKITATTEKSIDLLFYIPEGYRPIATTFQAAIDNTNDIAMNSSISTAGNAKLYRNHTTSMSSIRFHAEYFTD